MHVGIEVVTEGSPLEMGSAEGESLRKKVRSSPTCSRSCTVFGCCSHLDVLSVVPPGFRKPSQGFLETSLKRDFPEAHLRMKGIGQKNLGCEGLNPLSPIECGRLEVWYYRLRIRKEMFYLS